MRTIIRIDHIETRVDTKGELYYRIYATDNVGEEGYMYALTKDALKVDDEVMCAYDKGVIKFIKKT